MDFPQVFEALMMIAFGASWPMQILKTLRVKDPRGKSFLFLLLILFGYLSGIASKICIGHWENVIWLYILNTLMVGADLVLSAFYLRRIKQAEKH